MYFMCPPPVAGDCEIIVATRTQITGKLFAGATYIAYKISRSARRKRTISFFLESASSLRILAPLKTSQHTIDSLLQQRLPWIVRKTAEFKNTTPSTSTLNYINGDMLLYLGHSYRLHVTFDTTRSQGCFVRPKHLNVNLHNLDLNQDERSQEVRLEIMLWLKKRARIKFEKRMRFWADRLGVAYKKLVISNPDRRWGSCNHQNVIRLNWRLIMAPLTVIDYVVVHELCHVLHKNHAPRFWSQVAIVMPDYQRRQALLKTLGGSLLM